MEEIYDALHDLKRSIDEQVALQREANQLMRSLIDALNNNSQEMADGRAKQFTESVMKNT